MTIKQIADKVNDAILAATLLKQKDAKKLQNAMANGGTRGINSDIVHPTTIEEFIKLISSNSR